MSRWSTQPSYRAAVLRRKERTKAFFAEVRRTTHCARCGRQPVDFHHDDHPDTPQRRVSVLAHRGDSLGKIKAEIARCTPLCRRCHMLEDGRINRVRALAAARRGKRLRVPKPCDECGQPSRCRGKCNTHYARLRYHERKRERVA